MSRISNVVKIFVAGIFLCGIFLIGRNVSAAEINQEAMQIFRETLFQTARSNRRVFHQDILFIVPKFTGELEFIGAIEKDELKLKGSFEIWEVDETGNDEHIEKPFYLVQNSQNMVLYFQDNKKWQKVTTPVAAANVVDMFVTPNDEEINAIVDFIKEVTVLQDNSKQRTLLVKIDGEKIADWCKVLASSDNELKIDKSTEIFANIVDNGLRNSDFWYTWTVDKNLWQTTTMSFNLSGLVQSIATSALKYLPMTEGVGSYFSEFLETVAFYSEFKGYTTFLNPAAKEKLEIPKNVLKAKEVKNLNGDK